MGARRLRRFAGKEWKGWVIHATLHSEACRYRDDVFVYYFFV